MNATALALLSLATTVGQAPIPADIQVTKGRSLALGIRYNPDAKNQIQEARLFVSQDQGQTWFMKQSVLPPASEFVFTAKEDGLYYINMQLVYTDGKLEPADVARVAPAQKLIIDSTPPVVRITHALLNAEELSLEWTIDDKFPNDKATLVRYRPLQGGDADWQSVESASTRRSAKFKPAVAGPLQVQVIATDLAGNVGRGSRDVVPSTSSAYPPTSPLPAPNLAGTDPVPSTPIAPGVVNPGPVAVEPVMEPTAPAPISPISPAPRQIAGTPGTIPLTAPAASAPSQPLEVTPVQMVRTPRFELGYQLEGGPSGVARIDLYVTRDDGRTWMRWSTHPGTETPLKVILDTRFNTEVEGDYGFKLVAVSGAGLSDGAPTAGTPPEMKIHVDTSAPVIKVFQPTPDPNNRGALILHWEATDRNFGKDPIAIEYSESATGPWKPVTGGDGVMPVAVGANATPNRIANTGSYSWQLPANLMQPRLYLKFTAWDNAGNKSEVVTPNPVLVDLTKPKAKIQGILPTNPGK